MKKTLLAIAMATTAISSVANAAWTSPDGSLTIGGDAEINLDVKNDKNGTNKNVPNSQNYEEDNTSVQLADDSRIKLAVQWQNKREDGAYITARIEPLIRTDGQVKVDDAYFMFGREDAWAFQIGRYEAMNLFPLGKDVALFYADGSDGIGSGVYYYMAKEARGRRDTAGQARLIGEMGNWTAEVSTVYGNTADLLGAAEDNMVTSDGSNDALESSNNSFMIRPAINYLSDSGNFSFSFGGEYEANGDSVTLKNSIAAGSVYDLSKRYGLAATTTVVLGEVMWNTSIAIQDAKEAWDAQTFNTNFIYGNFGAGVSAAVNSYKNKTIDYTPDVDGDAANDKDAEDAKSYAIYAAYTMPILHFDNATVTFALSYSETQNAYGIDGNDEETTAFRTRFNYYF